MIIDKAEKFFKMPFKDIINKLHIKDKLSLNQLAKESGISRQSLTNVAKKMGLKTRTIQQATKLTKNKGAEHYAHGLTKDNSTIHKSHSIRMKYANPSWNLKAQEKRSQSISKTFIKNILPQEEIFRDFLISLNIKFEMQSPYGPYNLDFYIPSLKCAIEIDSTDKWGLERQCMSKKRDAYILKRFNIKTIRINKKYLGDNLFILNILKANNIIS